ncbi:MAG: DUF1501 domain-containing protein, partial [Gemmataceae bacterium]
KGKGYCDGLSRRDFLKVGALGVGAGLSLPELLRLKAQGAVRPETGNKSVIMICLSGGPSHMDMYDLKPAAPAEFRGEFKPIASNVPGMDLCELFPLQAKVADRFAIIRNMHFKQQGHTPPELLTGFVREDRPDIGAVVSKLRQEAGIMGKLPPYVSLGIQDYTAFLGNAHKPFEATGRGGQKGQSLALVKGVTADQLQDRRQLLKTFDSIHRSVDDARGSVAGMDAFHAQALEMISSPQARDAFDVDKEDPRVRDKYGKNKKLLLARRLVEAGVPVVTTTFYNPDPVPQGCNPHWDHHDHIYKCLRPLLPHLDQGLYALFSDIYERGLDKDVVVVVWGEMGRTPRLGTQKGTTAGRDHWPQSGFALMSGGGLRTGQVVGATDPRGENPKGFFYTPQNVLATVYRVLGYDPDHTSVPDLQGRPVHLLDDSTPIKELI